MSTKAVTLCTQLVTSDLQFYIGPPVPAWAFQEGILIWAQNRLAFCRLCLNEGWVIIDVNHPISSLEYRILSTPVSQSLKRDSRAMLPRFPFLFLKCIPKLTNFTWVYGWCVANSVTLGAPWGCSPWTIGCSYFTFCCTTGLAAKRGPAVW